MIVLRNNFLIAPDEEILFDYGLQVKSAPKRRNLRKIQTEVGALTTISTRSCNLILPLQSNPGSYLDEIRGFGGVEGLTRTKNLAAEGSLSQEIHSGLQLRVDILYSHKPVSRFWWTGESIDGLHSFSLEYLWVSIFRQWSTLVATNGETQVDTNSVSTDGTERTNG